MFQSDCQHDFGRLRKDIKRHEENIKFLKSLSNRLDESTVDLHASLGKYHSTNVPKAANEYVAFHKEKDATEQILKQVKSAAGVLFQLKSLYAIQASNFQLTKDVLGIVATLARVDDDNLSWLLSEYLGLETMLGAVCKTAEGVKALQKYDGEGKVNRSTGMHGLGCTIGRKIDGRFLVICLEDLRPYVGGSVAADSQRKLSLVKPKLPNGKCPSGFIDFAVNLINLEYMNLVQVTAGGHGLRETLFYVLFNHLQVYTTRTEMLHAVPCITHGAVSLDGGMIKRNGFFSLGSRKDVDVKFPVISCGSDLPANYIQIEGRIKMLKWEQQHIAEDIRREQLLLDQAKVRLGVKHEVVEIS